jgi:predicted nucleotidyltransferase
MEKEYNQAKLKAAEAYGDTFLPGNLEVAMELDTIADEREGSERKERLIRMRKEALELMKILKNYHPVLVGSVWRGTIHRESDIDITVCHDEPHNVVQVLTQNNLKIKRTENVAVTKKGKRKGSFHIHVELADKENAEIKINSSEDALTKEKCEIYGDNITGLHLHELQKLLNENPTQRFLPS